MPRMRFWLCGVLAVASGCLVPRSMVLGQTAAPVGRGATDLSVYTGVLYATQTNPSFYAADASRTTQRSNGVTAPNFEANLQYGFDDRFALNVHGSSAGVQPGLKWTLTKSKVVHVSLLPEVGLGFASTGSEVLYADDEGTDTIVSPTQGTSFTFLGGLKLLFSHRSGFYAGVGYDFLFNRNYNASLAGSGNTSEKREYIVQTTAHQVSASVGLDITLGLVHLRPEVAFAVYPGIGQTQQTRQGPDDTTVGATGGFGFAIFPGFSIAITTPKRELTHDEAQEEAEKHKKRRKTDDDDQDDDDQASGDADDDEVEVRKPKLKNKARLDDDEDEADPKKMRRRNQDDLDGDD